MDREHIDTHQGLTTQQVNQRIANQQVNKVQSSNTKSYQQILKDNVFTLFNFINFVLAILILFTESYKNLLFLGVVISNIIIGTYQEIRAKRTLDKISLINTMKVKTIRNGHEEKVSIEEVVLDDILKLQNGNQIICDCELTEGSLEVNESLLTGESDLVVKNIGDFLYSGSFVVGGNGLAQVVHVGNDNYAAQMVKDAKKFVKYPSELRDSLDKIIKYIGISIIPLGIILFFKHIVIYQQPLKDSILSTSAALIGMIPEGLVILTSIALAVGVIHLAKYHTLVQELYCIETLARVDVLCLDKTGTITEGKMEVVGYESEEKCFSEVVSNLAYYLQDDNATIQAIRDSFKESPTQRPLTLIPFNSSRKYSGIIYENEKVLMGAYNFVTKHVNSEIQAHVEELSKKGYRVISVVSTSPNDENLEAVKFLGHILLIDKIREDAKETLDYFRKQGVQIKIISGDHPATVSQIARRVGLDHYEAYVDATTLDDENLDEACEKYQIFGRVTPEQKKKLIRSLKKQGHCVGMSGDGVNDVLAFKEADVSIAMASGSDMAKSSANLVLLESNFDAMPKILYEGRRVINNIQRVATLFLTKTIFSILLTLVTILLPFEYPFIPIHLTFVSTLTIGIPAFFMALEPNKKRVENSFLENVLKISLPSGISVIICILLIYLFSTIKGYTPEMISQLALIVIAMNGCIVLTKVSFPLSRLRKIILVFAYICILAGLLFGHQLLSFEKIMIQEIVVEIGIFAIILLGCSYIGSKLVVQRMHKKKVKHETN